MARRKYARLEEIWDSNKEKLLVMGLLFPLSFCKTALPPTQRLSLVLDARGLASPKGVEGVFCQLTMGNAKYKTKTPKRPGPAPTWDEIFFLFVACPLLSHV